MYVTGHINLDKDLLLFSQKHSNILAYTFIYQILLTEKNAPES